MTRFKEDEAQLRVLVSALLGEARPSNGRCLRMRVHILDHNSEQPVDLQSLRTPLVGVMGSPEKAVRLWFVLISRCRVVMYVIESSWACCQIVRGALRAPPTYPGT